MSFLRKRSRSQCSFSKGDDQITVTKIHPVQINPKSHTETIRSPRSSTTWSTCSVEDATGFANHESCVLRKFPNYKSSHLKFLAWVAYTRKYTDEWIPDEEKRTCPLLFCRTIFGDQEAMLQHVWECPHLSEGQYWCFHCQKPERVGKPGCKHCQGAPSRTGKMAHVAKKIFSKLGARPHRKSSGLAMQSSPEKSKRFEEDQMPPYNPFLGSMPSSLGDAGPSNWSDPQELPNNAVVPEMIGDLAIELPDSHISEMVGTECPVELGVGTENWEDNFYAEEFEDFFEDIQPVPVKPRISSPKLAINTSFTHLNHMDMSHTDDLVSPQNYTANWNDNPLSATIISPMSATGSFGYSNFNGNFNLPDVSPTDSEASGNSFSTIDSGCSTQSSWSKSSSMLACDKYGETNIQKRSGQEFGNVPEDWTDQPFSKPLDLPVIPTSHIAVRMAPQVSTTMLPPYTFGTSEPKIPERPKLSSPHWNDAPSLVQSLSEALDAHILHTKSALKQLPSTPITVELLSLSKTTMTSIGLEVLAGILEGRNPTSMVQIFAFTHVACALGLTVNSDENMIYNQAWFRDSLSWAQNLTSERQRQLYAQIARSIWQPCEVSGESKSLEIIPREEKSNLLLSSCRHFLDVFESFRESTGDLTSGIRSTFNFSQTMFEYRAKMKVIDELTRAPSIEACAQDIVTVKCRLSGGKIASIRDLELDLICVGKRCSKSDPAYNKFLEHVTESCDRLYVDEGGRVQSRTAHHIQDISDIKRQLPEEIYLDEERIPEQTSRPQNGHAHEDEDLLLNLDFDAVSENADIQAFITELSKDLDQSLNQDFDFGNNLNLTSATPSHPISRNSSHHSRRNTNRHNVSSQPVSRSPSYHSNHDVNRSDFSNSLNVTSAASSLLVAQPSSHNSNQSSMRNDLTHISDTLNILSSPSSQPVSRTPSHHSNCDINASRSSIPAPQPVSDPSQSQPHSNSPTPSLNSKPSSKYRCRCGYEPAGEERWKASNLRRHQRTQHSVKMYACRYPGCKSTFSRTDNLGKHVKDKGHKVVDGREGRERKRRKLEGEEGGSSRE